MSYLQVDTQIGSLGLYSATNGLAPETLHWQFEDQCRGFIIRSVYCSCKRMCVQFSVLVWGSSQLLSTTTSAPGDLSWVHILLRIKQTLLLLFFIPSFLLRSTPPSFVAFFLGRPIPTSKCWLGSVCCGQSFQILFQGREWKSWKVTFREHLALLALVCFKDRKKGSRQRTFELPLRSVYRGGCTSFSVPWLPSCLDFSSLHTSSLGQQFIWFIEFLFPKKLLVGFIMFFSASRFW